MQFICYAKCGTCRKAKKWLDENGFSYEERDIKENKPSAEEIKYFAEKSGRPLKKFFNTSGLLYKQMGLKDKLGSMNDEEITELLATDGMLVKRPVLVAGDKILVGFKVEEWESELL
ncbi:MAG: arsenate reductase family protein [Firmicutes bacterium]|nr:arsenate reductase family protein [Bacillota bacterium]